MLENFDPYEKEIKHYTIGDEKTLKVGIISDSQIIPVQNSPNYFYKIFSQNLKNTLEVLKSQNIQALIFAGDLTDSGTEYAYDTINNIFNSVYKEGEKRPIFNFIMGNHDYWLSYSVNNNFSYVKGDSKQMQFLFYDKLKEKPLSHKVINGYHFINWGCENGSMDDPNQNVEWAENQIKIAYEDDKTKPIIVQTHFNAKDTVYGSNIYFAKNLREIFNKYPNIIHFSGHSHYSLIDERSIWQDEFTSIQTQSISYTELEHGFQNGIIPCDEYGDNAIAGKNYMGLIMDLTDNQCKMQRISFAENGILYGEPWIVDVPIDKNNFRYTLDKRLMKRNRPVFKFKNEEDKKIILEKDDKIKSGYALKFIAAFHEDFVYKYKVVLKNIKNNEIKEIFYVSDHFLLPKDRKSIMRYQFNKNGLDKGEYNIKIYAIESFGKESENFLEGNIIIE